MGQRESTSSSYRAAQWEWKSNPSPFSSSEKPQWTAYKPLDNYLIEKAHYNQKRQVDLGDHIVCLKEMLQKRKDEISKQRPIRRNAEYYKENEDESIRAQRFFGVETPRTFNSVFGNLSDYLTFFQNRGPDIQEFANLLEEVEISKNLDQLNQNILPQLINCIRNESKKLPKSTDKKQLLKKDQYEMKLLLLFQEALTSIQQFYANILKGYTMEGFLYKKLNQYLRNEDWTQLHSLLPYAYCLCKAFLYSELTQQQQLTIEIEHTEKITLYRGAQFDEISLSFYDQQIHKTFCWNGMTSTSTKRAVAEKFMYRNIDLKRQVPVMCMIEVPLNPKNTKIRRWLDIKAFSAIKSEDEVVLAPGSVFEVLKVSRDHQKGAEIHLKLISDVEKLAHKGQILHGAMHSEMAKGTEVKIVCLEGNELAEALAHLQGNQLIEDLEFCLCKFNEKVLKSLPNTLKTLPKLKKLIFISPSSADQTHFSSVFKQLKMVPLQALEIFHKPASLSQDQLSLSQGIQCLTSLMSLNLDFSWCNQVTDEGLNNLCYYGIRHLTSLTSLNLNATSCSEITDEGLKNLCLIGIKPLGSLTSLGLNFICCSQITDKGLYYLYSQGLKNKVSLASFGLYIFDCKVTDEGLNLLCSEGIKDLTSLVSLTLCIARCPEITEKGLSSLASQGLKFLSSLKSLNLNFSFCPQIKNQGLSDLCSEGIQHLASLTSLTLNFKDCSRIKDEGINSLSFQEFKNLTSLTLDFTKCHRITDQGLTALCWQGIKNLTSLTLRFTSLFITDQGLSSLASQEIKFLTLLTSLTLDFTWCENISDKCLNNLSSEGISHLTLLQSLTLNFSFCSKITDEGLRNLCSQGIQPLTSLTFLNLCVDYCEKITREGRSELTKLLRSYKTTLNHNNNENMEKMMVFTRELPMKEIPEDERGISRNSSESLDATIILNSKNKLQNFKESFIASNFSNCESIKIYAELFPTMEDLCLLIGEKITHLAQLTSLALNFNFGFKITDQELNHLSIFGIKPLASLKSLNLNFKNNHDSFTDKGIYDLCSQGIRNLSELTSLTLNFSGCSKITDEGLNCLYSEGINFLPLLETLNLNFSHCEQITDRGLSSQAPQGIKHLTSLTLDFSFCSKITDEGLSSLCSLGLLHLNSFTTLTLNFSSCRNLTDRGLKNLCSQGIKYHTLLRSLALNFRLCEQITDEGLNSICSQAIKNLNSLISLTLDFSWCRQITDAACQNFCKILKYFGFQRSQSETN